MQQIAPDRTDAVSRLAELHGRPYLCLRFPRGGAKEPRRAQRQQVRLGAYDSGRHSAIYDAAH